MKFFRALKEVGLTVIAIPLAALTMVIIIGIYMYGIITDDQAILEDLAQP